MIHATTPEANHKRIAKNYGGAWWREQSRILERWQPGYPAPAGLKLGSLPEAPVRLRVRG